MADEKKTPITDSMKKAYATMKGSVGDFLGGKKTTDQAIDFMTKVGTDYLKNAGGKGSGYVKPFANEFAQAYAQYLAQGGDPIYFGATVLEAMQGVLKPIFEDSSLVAKESGIRIPDEIKKRQEQQTLEAVVRSFIITGKKPGER